jgi:hypothetical protein
MAAAWIVLKVISLPYLYSLKPYYAFFGAFVFFQSSAGLALLAYFLDDHTPKPTLTMNLMILTVSPFLTAILTLIYYRIIWDKVWDVCLSVRYAEQKEMLKSTMITRVIFRKLLIWWKIMVSCGKEDTEKILAEMASNAAYQKEVERERKIAKMMAEEAALMNA